MKTNYLSVKDLCVKVIPDLNIYFSSRDDAHYKFVVTQLYRVRCN